MTNAVNIAALASNTNSSGAISSSGLQSNSVTSSALASSAVTEAKLANNINLSNINAWNTPYSTFNQEIPFSGSRYILLWNRSNSDGKYFYGIMSWTNYDGPSSYHIHIHNGYPITAGNSANFGYASGVAYGGTSQLQVQRVTYSGGSWIAIYNSGPTNRNIRLIGINNAFDGINYPLVVSSVTSTDATYVTL